jgi:hypothetical protein
MENGRIMNTQSIHRRILRPVNGYTSGPLWQELFKFTLHTKFTINVVAMVLISLPNKHLLTIVRLNHIV